jgi:hypothetical protein
MLIPAISVGSLRTAGLNPPKRLRPKVEGADRSRFLPGRAYAGMSGIIHYSTLAAIVLQAETLPSPNPLENQRLRCSEVPWVKASGTT